MWAEISAADLRFVITEEPRRVAAAYRNALAGAPDFAAASVRKQLAIYRDLLGVNLAEVFKVVGEPPSARPEGWPAALQRKRVLLFAGHMIDAANREKLRFPADKEGVARERIREAVLREVQSGAGVASGTPGVRAAVTSSSTKSAPNSASRRVSTLPSRRRSTS